MPREWNSAFQNLLIKSLSLSEIIFDGIPWLRYTGSLNLCATSGAVMLDLTGMVHIISDSLHTTVNIPL